MTARTHSDKPKITRTRKTMFHFGLSLLLIFLLASCFSIKELPKYGFSDGIYNAKIEKGAKREKVYVDVSPDSLAVYPIARKEREWVADTLQKEVFLIPEETEQINKRPFLFTKHSFDIDILSFPLVYRFGSENVPPQLNPSLSAALYFGYRGDDFKIRYKKTLLGKNKRFLNYFSHSFGLFLAVASPPISETTTNGHEWMEYNGVALRGGGAFLIGLNDFTIGFAIGFDHLMDKNKDHWVYQNKPWLGLTLGLSLN